MKQGKYGGIRVLFCVLFALDSLALAKVIHVNAAAAPGGDGEGWATAFRDLQDGMGQATNGDEVWVAAGTYCPDEGAGMTDGDRAATFELGDGVTMLGGFAGGEAAASEREAGIHVTTLSGGISADEADRSIHVVTVIGSGILDGLTITKGNANGMEAYDRRGGGIFAPASCKSLTLRNCCLVGNQASDFGGALYSLSSSMPITAIGSIFHDNKAGVDGGGDPNFLYITKGAGHRHRMRFFQQLCRKTWRSVWWL